LESLESYSSKRLRQYQKIWIREPKGVEYEGDGAEIIRGGEAEGDGLVVRAYLGENEGGGGKRLIKEGVA
jgi:hypothetical protein